MALATLFVTMPFVARELIPILEAMDMAQEEAARTLGASDFEVLLAGIMHHYEAHLVPAALAAHVRERLPAPSALDIQT
jgi:ABC-type sulfate transport system permease component